MMSLDPAVETMAEAMAANGFRPFSDFDPAGARAQLARMQADMNAAMGDGGASLFAIEDVAIAAEHGVIGARRYRPRERTPGTVVYYHGGGWVLGELEDYDRPLKALAAQSGCDVLSVDYRLAPEHRFPAAVEDALTALRWAGAQPGAGPIAVAGDSAGGNLAAVATQSARDEGGPQVVYQVLAYPVSDCDFGTSSYLEWSDAPILPSRDMQWYWNHYVPDSKDRSDPRASPLRAESFANLPPALIVVAECDPLRDEVRSYAHRLQQAGVEVEHYEGVGMPHGFFTFNGVLPQGDEVLALAARRLHDRIVGAAAARSALGSA
jgi:acetyl esterase